MVIYFNIIDSLKIIDKEIDELKKKSDKEINELYTKYLKKEDPKVNFLYQMFEKYYKVKLFTSNIISILKKNNLSLNFLLLENDFDYIKNFGYTKINKIGQGAYGTVYLGKKNKKKYAIKMQKFNNDYWLPIEIFLEQNINEYEKLKKLNKYSISPKVYDIIFIFNEKKMEVYSLIFMEHIDGITLMQYKQQKGNLDEKNKQKLNDKILKLHKLDVYHRDLHEGNIIVVKKGKNIDFMIIDMGFAISKKKIIDNANKDNKKVLEGYLIKKSDDNKNLYIALTNSIKKGEIDLNFPISKHSNS
jgi:serine/threonine protein kinase